MLNNTASLSGAGLENRGQATIHESSFRDNNVCFYVDHDFCWIGGNGGAINNRGTLLLRRATLSGNRAHRGGGLSNDASGIAQIVNSTITRPETTKTGLWMSRPNGPQRP